MTIAEQIAEKLVTGLVHPGNPETGQPEITIALPVFRITGLPEEVAKQVTTTTRLIAEAIVALIEAEHAIVGKSELGQLQYVNDSVAGVEAGMRITPVHCKCDRSFSDPLMLLTVNGDNRIVVDGTTLIKGLSNRAAKCPHKVITHTAAS